MSSMLYFRSSRQFSTTVRLFSTGITTVKRPLKQSKSHTKSNHSGIFVCPPGLESSLLTELYNLFPKLKQSSASPSPKSSPYAPLSKTTGGILFNNFNTRQMYLSHLSLTLPTRILIRLARFRKVKEFSILEANLLRWKSETGGFSNFVDLGVDNSKVTDIRTTCTLSKLYHSNAVEQRIRKLALPIPKHFDALANNDVDDDGNNNSPSQLMVVRVANDNVTISASMTPPSSSSILQRRYREEGGKAPLSFNLANAMLLSMGWGSEAKLEEHGRMQNLVDPMCGSGTICIEAALMLVGGETLPVEEDDVYSGGGFYDWKDFNAGAFASAKHEINERIKTDSAGNDNEDGVKIFGFDIDKKAILIARRNAERAGVGHMIKFSYSPIGKLKENCGDHESEGLLVTNPPWGIRLKGKGKEKGKEKQFDPLQDLYSTIGNVRDKLFPKFKIGVLVNEKRQVKNIHNAKMMEIFSSKAGAHKVHFFSDSVVQEEEEGVEEKVLGVGVEAMEKLERKQEEEKIAKKEARRLKWAKEQAERAKTRALSEDDRFNEDMLEMRVGEGKL